MHLHQKGILAFIELATRASSWGQLYHFLREIKIRTFDSCGHAMVVSLVVGALHSAKSSTSYLVLAVMTKTAATLVHKLCQYLRVFEDSVTTDTDGCGKPEF